MDKCLAVKAERPALLADASETVRVSQVSVDAIEYIKPGTAQNFSGLVEVPYHERLRKSFNPIARI